MNKLSIFHQNIAGALNKQDNLICVLDSLSKDVGSLDVICLTETYIRKGTENNLKIKQYDLAASFSRENKRGGVIILVKNDLRFRKLNDLNSISQAFIFECCGIELIDHGIIIVGLYTHKTPTSPKSMFFKKLLDLLYIITRNKRKKVILCGDININILIKSLISVELCRLLELYNIKTHINQPTRITKTSKTCLDQIMSNIDNGTAQVHDLGLSDHTAQSFTFNLNKSRDPPPLFWFDYVRDYSLDNKLKFLKYLSSLTFTEIYSVDISPDNAFKHFFDMYVLLYNLCFPVTKVRKSSNHFRNNWISKGIKKCTHIKRKLHLLCRKRLINKTYYKDYSKILRKCMRLSQKIGNTKYIVSAQNKCKAAWNIVKRYTTDYSNATIMNINVHDNIIDDPQTICNFFNDYFLNNIIYDSTLTLNSDTNKYVKLTTDSIFLSPVGTQEIINIVRSLKNSQAVGFDGIRTDMVKMSIHLIVGPLTYIINRCLVNGIFPDILKQTIIKPIFKKGDRTSMNNYRPVALISIFSKIFEKVIYTRLLTFFEKKNIIVEEQNGFRKGKSTSLATFNLVKTIGDSLNNKVPIAVLFLDMSRAFDYVCHQTLLEKLYKYGIRGPAHNLIKNYLSDRSQCVEIKTYNKLNKCLDTYRSTFKNNNYGVPQGSVLGPLMFLAYINDLPNALSHNCILFADDATVIVTDKSRSGTLDSQVKNALTDVVKWLSANNLKINLQKTKCMQFYTNGSKPQVLNINFDGQIIEHVATTKFLGITLDSNCGWKQHIEGLCSKINRFIFVLRRVSQVVSREVAITAYNGYVSSSLRYGIIMWGNSGDSVGAFILQKRCIRSIFGLKQLDSCRPYFKKYRLLTLPCLYIMEVSIFVHKHKNLFQQNCEASTRLLRNQYRNKLYKPPSRLQLVSKNSFIMCIQIYNKLPEMLKEMKFNKFKNCLKTWLTERCFYTVKEFLDGTF